MTRSIAATVSLAAMLGAMLASAAGPAIAADAAGTCGKGKVFNPDTQTCVAKPKRTGSGSNSG